MDSEPKSPLRNPGEKKRAPNRKVPSELDDFVAEWCRLFVQRGAIWEGVRAITELKEKDAYDVFLCKSGTERKWQLDELGERVLEEINLYRKEAEYRRITEFFNDAAGFLNKEIEKVRKRQKLAPIPEVKTVLQDLDNRLKRSIQFLDSLKTRRAHWQFGMKSHFWPETPRKNLAKSKTDLDIRLQVEIGKAFAELLLPKNVSLETIARLVLLACVVGRVAQIKEGVAVNSYSGRPLKVRNIRDILKANKISKGHWKWDQ